MNKSAYPDDRNFFTRINHFFMAWKNTLNNRQYALPGLVKIILPFFLVALIGSCNGQNTRPSKPLNISDTNSIESKSMLHGQPKITKTHNTSIYDNVHCGLEDKNGNLWFGTTGEGVFRYDGKSFINFTVKDGLPNNNIWCMLEDKAGNIWFGTNNGIGSFDGKKFTQFIIPGTETPAYKSFFVAGFNTTSAAENVPSSKTVMAIIQDNNGDIWFGTEGGGAFRYDGKTFTNYLNDSGWVYDDGHHHNAIGAMLADKKGNLWMNSYRYDRKHFTNFTKKDGIKGNWFKFIIEDNAGSIWLGAWEQGLFRNDGQGFKKFTAIGKPLDYVVQCMLQDRNGNYWFGTDGLDGHDGYGLLRYDGKTVTNFTTKDGLADNRVFSITEDRSGNIWFGTRNVGLSKYDGKKFTNFSEKNAN